MHKYAGKFADYCKQNMNIDDKIIPYSYQSMSICIIDCVYSLRAQYNKATKGVVKKSADKYMNGNEDASGNTVTDLINNIEAADGPISFAGDDYLHNKQYSGRVLKSEICLNLARYLNYLQIDTIDDFRNYEAPEFLETVIHSVKGIGDSGTHYLLCLLVIRTVVNRIDILSVVFSMHVGRI